MKKIISTLLKKSKVGKRIYNLQNARERMKRNKKLSENAETRENQVIFSSFQGRSYSCSPRAIYEYMSKSVFFQEYTFIWAFSNPNSKARFFADNRTKLVKYNSLEFFQYLSTSKYWVFNFKTPDYFIKREDQIFVQCWHGTPLKRLGCDIVVDGNKATNREEIHASYINDARKYNYFISPSQYCTEKFITAFALDQLNKRDIIIEQGYPRNDELFHYSSKKVEELKIKLQIPLDKKVILYAPTFRDNQYKQGVGHTYQLGINLLRMKDELSDEYVILLRLHYLISNKIDIGQFKNFAYDVSKYDNVNDLYIISDMLITDYSSVFFDYANLKRPILFYMYDLNEYKNSIRDFYIDLEEMPGPITENEHDLIDNIRNIKGVWKEYESLLIEFNKKYNSLDDGQATIRVIKEIFNCD